MIDGKMLNFLFEYWPATPATREEPEAASDIEIIQITDMEGNDVPIPPHEDGNQETVLDRMYTLLLDALSNNETNEVQVNIENNMTFPEETGLDKSGKSGKVLIKKKTLYIHLPDQCFIVRIVADFDKVVNNLSNILTNDKSCWVPVRTLSQEQDCESHIFLSGEMKKRVYLRTLID